MPLNLFPKRELFYRFRKGDSAAFKEIYETHYTLLSGIAWRITHDPLDAEDIVQESFAKLWENRANITGYSKIKPFLLQVTRNASIDQARKTHRTALKHEELARAIGFQENEIEAAEEGAYTQYLIDRAIEKLPKTCKKIFILRYAKHKSVREIAELLRISEKTVANNVSRAIAKLKITFLKGKGGSLPVLIFLTLNIHHCLLLR